MSVETSSRTEVIEFRIVLQGMMEIGPGEYSLNTYEIVSDSREGTRWSAEEWSSEELGFYSWLRLRSSESLLVSSRYWLEIMDAGRWVTVKPLEASPGPAEDVTDTLDSESEDGDLEVLCPGPCGQTVDMCTCEDLVSRTRMTPVRRRAVR
jgi:hypothetical protein